MAVDLVDCVGSTVTDFMQDAGTKFGTGSLGKTKPTVSYAYDDDGNNKLAKVTLTLSIVSKTAHWAAYSGPNPGRHTQAPIATGSGISNRQGAAVSSISAAIAWRSPAALSARTSAPSR